jgi:hypothetical protein
MKEFLCFEAEHSPFRMRCHVFKQREKEVSNEETGAWSGCRSVDGGDPGLGTVRRVWVWSPRPFRARGSGLRLPWRDCLRSTKVV